LSPKREKDAALLVAKIDKNVRQGVCSWSVKHPYDDNWENQNPELCIPKSFSLKRKMIAAARARAKALGVSTSGYVAALIHNDLERGMAAPLSIESSQRAEQSPKGVVVPGFDLED
jgi:hypothetical protein